MTPSGEVTSCRPPARCGAGGKRVKRFCSCFADERVTLPRGARQPRACVSRGVQMAPGPAVTTTVVNLPCTSTSGTAAPTVTPGRGRKDRQSSDAVSSLREDSRPVLTLGNVRRRSATVEATTVRAFAQHVCAWRPSASYSCANEFLATGADATAAASRLPSRLGGSVSC